jgi:ATP-binding cassette, subfamily C (CFTR/MRP), member 1
VLLLLLLLHCQRFYRATSRELQRLESVSRSPIFAHFAEALGGAATLRAFGAEDRVVAESQGRQARNNRAYFAKTAAEIWLTARLMFVGAAVVFLCAASIVLLHAHLGQRVNPGMAGVALAYALNIVINLNMSIRNRYDSLY